MMTRLGKTSSNRDWKCAGVFGWNDETIGLSFKQLVCVGRVFLRFTLVESLLKSFILNVV